MSVSERKNRGEIENSEEKREKSANLTPSLSTFGTSQIVCDAIIEVNQLVETMHKRITGPFWNLMPAKHVYNSITQSTQWIKKNLQASLQELDQFIAENQEASAPTEESRIKRETFISALNGVIGHYLYETQNPLELQMTLTFKGKSYPIERIEEIFHSTQTTFSNRHLTTPPSKWIIFIHGSCMSEHQWRSQAYDYANCFAEPNQALLYLRYNSGRHISENGQLLSQLLEALHRGFYKILDEKNERTDSNQQPSITFVAHSMGGLVARSACYYAEQKRNRWLESLQKMIMLGTPHHGAPLERIGNLTDTLLQFNRYSAPFTQLLKVRSYGVTDLRYGDIIDEDWQERSRFKMSGDKRQPVPLPSHVNCYAIAGTLNKKPSRVAEALSGDGLVTVSSALGHHNRTSMQLDIPPEQQWIGYGLSHNKLLGCKEVAAVLDRWLG